MAVSKKVLLIAVFILLVSSLQAQTFIPKFGCTLSNIGNRSDQYDFQNRFGLNGGLAFNLPLSKKIELQPELLFVQKGWKMTNPDSNDPWSDYWRLNYLEMPVLVNYSLDNFFLYGGPAIGYGLNGWTRFKSQSQDLTSKVDFKSDGTFRDYVSHRWDFGFVLGCGVRIKNYMVVDFRYDLGTSKLYSKPYDSFIGAGSNRTFMILIGVPIKKLSLVP